ncbi:MAG: T9SS type A sorting domain-containing protein, partial [Bacteroidota bacterium]
MEGEAGRIALFDLQGKMVMQQTFERHAQVEMDLSELGRGFYLYRVEMENGGRQDGKLLVK